MLWFAFQCLLVALVVLIPAPNRDHTKRFFKPCSRPQSSVVRQLIHKIWRPLYLKYNQSLPLQCPLHMARDIFHQQEMEKISYKSNLWKCGFCGKSFHSHISLDKHMASRHEDALALDRNADTCLADFCDIFRCHTYLPRDILDGNPGITAKNLSVYQKFYPDFGLLKPPATSSDLSVIPSNSDFLAYLDKLQGESFNQKLHQDYKEQEGVYVSTRKRPSEDDDDSSFFQISNDKFYEGLSIIKRHLTKRKSSSKLDEQVQPQSVRGQPMQDGQEEEEELCQVEEMEKSYQKCQELLDVCTNSLQLNMENKAFILFRNELHDSTCWYLNCNRYYNSLGMNFAGVSFGKNHWIKEALFYIGSVLFLIILVIFASFIVGCCL